MLERYKGRSDGPAVRRFPVTRANDSRMIKHDKLMVKIPVRFVSNERQIRRRERRRVTPAKHPRSTPFVVLQLALLVAVQLGRRWTDLQGAQLESNTNGGNMSANGNCTGDLFRRWNTLLIRKILIISTKRFKTSMFEYSIRAHPLDFISGARASVRLFVQVPVRYQNDPATTPHICYTSTGTMDCSTRFNASRTVPVRYSYSSASLNSPFSTLHSIIVLLYTRTIRVLVRCFGLQILIDGARCPAPAIISRRPNVGVAWTAGELVI